MFNNKSQKSYMKTLMHTKKQVGFPGTVEFNGRQTSDTVVPITVLDPSDEVVKGFLVEQGDSAPQW